MKTNVLILFLMTSFCYGHITKTFKKSYNNVNVTVSVNEINEKINSAFIIGQYFNIMSKSKKYNYVINVSFFEDYYKAKTFGSITKTIEKDTLNIVFVNSFFSINESLKILEFICENPSKINIIQKKYDSIVNSKNSSFLNKVILQRIFRPNEIKELNNDYFSYYYEKDSYMFFNLDNNEKLFELKEKLSSFFVVDKNNILLLTSNNLLIFKLLNKEIIKKIINSENLKFSYDIIKLNDNIIYFHNKSRMFENFDLIYLIDNNSIIYDLEKFVNKYSNISN